MGRRRKRIGAFSPALPPPLPMTVSSRGFSSSFFSPPLPLLELNCLPSPDGERGGRRKLPFFFLPALIEFFLLPLFSSVLLDFLGNRFLFLLLKIQCRYTCTVRVLVHYYIVVNSVLTQTWPSCHLIREETFLDALQGDGNEKESSDIDTS